MPNFSGIWNLKEQVQAIAAGRWTGLPLYELYTWGLNTSGQLGQNNTITGESSPVQVGALTDWTQVTTVGFSHTTSVKSDGTLWAWGSNTNGRLGDGTVVAKSSPVQIGGLTNWYQVSAGSAFVSAIKTDGTLWAWGYNFNGQLGTSNTISRSSPVQVGALTTWASIGTGNTHNLAVKTDGTLWVWGSDSNGNLGLGTLDVARSSPTQVGALTNWEKTAGGNDVSSAVKTDGTLWMWGINTNGQLGDNTVGRKLSPVQVGALTTWSEVSPGGSHTLAVKTDGTLWSWGKNSQGQLGTNESTLNYKSSPVQIGALTNWSNVSGRVNSSIASKSDGTLWTWGWNAVGQLGHNNTTDLSSPVQVGGLTNWGAPARGGAASHNAASTVSATN